MTEFKKIMVALAFSEHSKGILQFSANLAQHLNAELVVASIINQRDIQAVQTISDMGYNVNGEQYIDDIREERKILLQQFLSELDLPADKVKVIFKTGNPIDELLKLCLTADVNMIVMGIKGRTNLENVFVGSVAEKMFRRSPITIVSYRDPASSERLKKRIEI